VKATPTSVSEGGNGQSGGGWLGQGLYEFVGGGGGDAIKVNRTAPDGTEFDTANDAPQQSGDWQLINPDNTTTSSARLFVNRPIGARAHVFASSFLDTPADRNVRAPNAHSPSAIRESWKFSMTTDHSPIRWIGRRD
jgi:hypothetical protein